VDVTPARLSRAALVSPGTGTSERHVSPSTSPAVLVEAGLRMLLVGIYLATMWLAVAHVSNRMGLLLLAIGLTIIFGILISSSGLQCMHPQFLILGAFYVYGFLTPVMLYQNNNLRFYGTNIDAVFPTMMFATLVALIAYVIGCNVPITWRSVTRVELTRKQYDRFGVAMAAAGVGGFMLWVYLRGEFVDRAQLLPTVEGPGNTVSIGYLLAAQHLSVPAMAFLATAHRSRFWRSKAPYLMVPMVLAALSTGSRSQVLMILMPGVLVAILARRRLPPLTVALSVACVLSVGYIALGYVRSQTQVGEAATLPGIIASLNVNNLTSDTSVTQTFALLLDRVPEDTDYLYGSSFSYMIIQAIPRHWYPEKGLPPELDLLWRYTNYTSGFATMSYGGLYVNFGYVGIAAGMLFFGLYSSLAYHTWRLRESSSFARIFLAVAIVLQFLTFNRGSFAGNIGHYAFMLGPLLGMIVWSRYFRSTSASRHGWRRDAASQYAR